jgi:glycosyltransferase involved in cell wall biosynthesis
MHVSVIIPVRNNVVGLEVCLKALERQTYPADEFEIIVIDNASTDDLSRLQPVFPQVRWIRDEGSGSFAARNAGLLLAQGDIVAFTDSDCIPEPDWLAEGVAALDAGLGTIIGGNVDLLDPVGREMNVYEWMEVIGSGLPDSRRLVEERGFTTTGNMLTYRKNFIRCGPFDTVLKSGGDREWVTRAVKLGEKLVYVDSFRVRHPRRSTFKDLILKYRRQVGGRMTLLKRTNPSARAILGELFLLSIFDPRIWAIAFFYPKIRTIRRRIHFIGGVLWMSLLTTAERFRVWLGADTSRG